MSVKRNWLLLLGIVLLSCKLPKTDLFLIGDSISIEYGKYLKEYVSGFAVLERKQDDGAALKNLDIPMGTNGGDSRMVLLYLRSKLEEPGFKPDYLLVNCGLHDIKRHPETHAIQVSQREYRSNLAEIFRLLTQKGIQPIWIRTTWVVDRIHQEKSKAFSRYHADVREYNTIADEVCAAQGIPSIDLYTLSVSQGEAQLRDHVHYTPAAQQQQAAYIADFLRTYIK